MTLYTRGYRRYEDGFAARRLRFLPILSEGYREAARTKSFRVFTWLFVGFMLLFALLYYLNPRDFGNRHAGGASMGEALRIILLREFIGSYLFVLDCLAPLLVLFVGSGLVAEDLRTRALPLYLVRPITPVDYWLGKLLVIPGVLAIAFLMPALFLVLFGILLEPTGNVLAFASKQGSLVLAILCVYVATSAAYGSLVLLVSTVAGRRVRALVLGAGIVFLSPVVVGLAVSAKTHGHQNPEAAIGGSFELVKGLMLPGDIVSIFRTVSDSGFNRHQDAMLPPLGVAIGMIGALFLLTAFVVIRRARSVEVVS